MRFQKGPTNDMEWDFDFYEPLRICLFNAQLTVTWSFNSLHSSLVIHNSERSASLREGCGLGSYLPEVAGREMVLSFIWLQNEKPH